VVVYYNKIYNCQKQTSFMKTLNHKIKKEFLFSEFKKSLKEGEKETKLTFSCILSVDTPDKKYITPRGSISWDMPSYSIPSYDAPSYNMDVE